MFLSLPLWLSTPLANANQIVASRVSLRLLNSRRSALVPFLLLVISLYASNSLAQEPSKEPAGGLVASATSDSVDAASINAAIT
ncbi:MAG: hypothetical protein ACKO81_09730, partial [Planctomycetota bacterium]